MSNNKNMNNADVNENKNTVPETPAAGEEKKIRLKDRIRNFGEKHPKLTKVGTYAAAVGAGALVALGGKSILEALGGHPGASEYDYESGDPTSAAEPAAKKEETAE